MGIGKAGAKNAALLAIEMLALKDDGFKRRLDQYRADMKRTVLEEDEGIKNL
ncbi:MAG: hypothetical protein RRA35_05465 [Desulfomonilia bacterium]|nr:hypothetical protein [Desulfomonilia bacterium]